MSEIASCEQSLRQQVRSTSLPSPLQFLNRFTYEWADAKLMRSPWWQMLVSSARRILREQGYDPLSLGGGGERATDGRGVWNWIRGSSPATSVTSLVFYDSMLCPRPLDWPRHHHMLGFLLDYGLAGSSHNASPASLRSSLPSGQFSPLYEPSHDLRQFLAGLATRGVGEHAQVARSNVVYIGWGSMSRHNRKRMRLVCEVAATIGYKYGIGVMYHIADTISGTDSSHTGSGGLQCSVEVVHLCRRTYAWPVGRCSSSGG